MLEAPAVNPPDEDTVLLFDRVSVIRSGNFLLRGLSWSVELDERWVVLGPNGAGKTTLLNLASARMHPSRGAAWVLGERLGRVDVNELRTRVGLTTGSFAERVPPDERVLDVVVTAAWSVVGRWREQYDPQDEGRARQLLGQLGMGSLIDREFGTLSEGERKRTQIARALMTDPELMLLDEPTAGLDLGGREDLVGRLTELAEDPDAPAMVLVTHHVEEIPPGFTHALLLREGTVVASGLLTETLTAANLSKTFGLPLVVQRSGRSVHRESRLMAPRIVVAGSANMDLVGLAATLPRPGETVLGEDFVMTPGGKGANQAIAAVRAGGDVTFLGAIGSDAFGVTINARLSASGVDTRRVRTSYGTSGVAVIMVDRAGENSILVSPGANSTFVSLTDAEIAAIGDADVLVCQQEIPAATVTAAARAAQAAGTRVVLNAAPARELSEELLGAVDLLVVNQVEARAIAPDVDQLLEVVPRVVLTLGGDGAVYAGRDGTNVRIPAFAVKVADTTAAGDAFTGALAVAWGEGRDLADAARWACAAGAACVRKVGAFPSLPTRAEIDELYEAQA